MSKYRESRKACQCFVLYFAIAYASLYDTGGQILKLSPGGWSEVVAHVQQNMPLQISKKILLKYLESILLMGLLQRIPGFEEASIVPVIPNDRRYMLSPLEPQVWADLMRASGQNQTKVFEIGYAPLMLDDKDIIFVADLSPALQK